MVVTPEAGQRTHRVVVGVEDWTTSPAESLDARYVGIQVSRRCHVHAWKLALPTRRGRSLVVAKGLPHFVACQMAAGTPW